MMRSRYFPALGASLILASFAIASAIVGTYQLVTRWFEHAIAFIAEPFTHSLIDTPALALDATGAALPSSLQHDMRHEAGARRLRGSHRNI